MYVLCTKQEINRHGIVEYQTEYVVALSPQTRTRDKQIQTSHQWTESIVVLSLKTGTRDNRDKRTQQQQQKQTKNKTKKI